MNLRKNTDKPVTVNSNIEGTYSSPPASPPQSPPIYNQPPQEPQYYDVEYTPIQPQQPSPPPQQQGQPNYQSVPGTNGQPQIHVHINNSNVNTANATNAGPMYSDKSRWLAFFLCLFLGWFGIHRFYLGKPISGLIWFFTVGLFFIGWIYDGVNLFLNNAKDGRGYPLR